MSTTAKSSGCRIKKKLAAAPQVFARAAVFYRRAFCTIRHWGQTFPDAHTTWILPAQDMMDHRIGHAGLQFTRDRFKISAFKHASTSSTVSCLSFVFFPSLSFRFTVCVDEIGSFSDRFQLLQYPSLTAADPENNSMRTCRASEAAVLLPDESLHNDRRCTVGGANQNHGPNGAQVNESLAQRGRRREGHADRQR